MSAGFQSGHFIPELRQRLDEKPFDIDKSRQLSAYILGIEAKGYSCSSREDKLWEELTWLIEITQASRAYYCQKVVEFIDREIGENK